MSTKNPCNKARGTSGMPEQRPFGSIQGPFEVRVASQRQLSSNAYLLSLDWQPDFVAGQMIGLQSDPGLPPRLYSIASAPQSRYLEILYTLVQGGQLTNHLVALSGGETLYAWPPRGEFTDRGPSSWYIANGSGVAPFLSMIRAQNQLLKPPVEWHKSSGANAPFKQEALAPDKGPGRHATALHPSRTLIHGARFLPDLYCADELAGSPGVAYIGCLSAPLPEPSDAGTVNTGTDVQAHTFPGRLTAYLSEQIDAGLIPGTAEQNARRTYMLCGSEAMIIQVRQMLITAGVDFSRIISEIYF